MMTHNFLLNIHVALCTYKFYSLKKKACVLRYDGIWTNNPREVKNSTIIFLSQRNLSSEQAAVVISILLTNIFCLYPETYSMGKRREKET